MPTTWEIDPNHTTVEFAVKHMMFTTVRGRFKDVKGTITADEATAEIDRREWGLKWNQALETGGILVGNR